MECPDCKSEIGNARYCGCGWQKPSKRDRDEPLPMVNCVYADCLKPAIMREKTPTGWANLCHFHMMQRHHDRAEKYCADRGLDTVAKKRAYVLNLLKRKTPTIQPEPGCNTEPLTHAMNRVREIADDLPW